MSRGFSGVISSGSIGVGDPVVVLPSARTSTVKAIVNGFSRIERAIAGQAVTVMLADEVDASRGDVLVATDDRPSVADQFDKRKILIWTQVVQIALAITIGLLIFAGQIQIRHIITVAGLLGIAFAFEHPALSALVPELVCREEIAGAVALALLPRRT